MENNGRQLGLGGLIFTSVGSGLGVAIVAYIGVVIGVAGKGAVLSVTICVLLGAIMALPYWMLSRLTVFNGGSYSMIKRAMSPPLAAMDAYSNTIYTVAYTTFALSIVNYIVSIVPSLAPYTKAITIALAILVCVLLCCDIRFYDKIQTVCTIALLIGLVAFIVLGARVIIQNGTNIFDFNDEIYAEKGIGGVLEGVPLIIGQTMGYIWVIYYGPVAKNPKKTIPVAAAVGCVCIMSMWIGLTIVDANILPISEVANKPLTSVAQEIMSPAMAVLFVVLGPIMCIFTSYIGGIQTPVAQMSTSARDGWLPKIFTRTNSKGRNYPVYIFVTVIICVVVLLGVSVEDIVRNIALIGALQLMLAATAFLNIPRKQPEIFATGRQKSVFKVVCGISFVVSLGNFALSVRTISPLVAICDIAAIVLLYLFCRYWIKSGHVRTQD